MARGQSQLKVYWAMRYGSPSTAQVIARIVADGACRLWVLPLYPQHSDTTTETAWLACVRALQAIRATDSSAPLPELIGIPSYPDHPLYIAALVESIHTHWQTHGQPDFAAGARLLLSFHGLPERNIRDGDPYCDECSRTHAALTAALGLPDEQVLLAYQSRFGRARWVGPASSTVVADLARAACPRLDVICPGFAADCLETLEEVNEGLRHDFERGGGVFHYIPCLNGRDAHTTLISELIASAQQTAQTDSWAQQSAALPPTTPYESKRHRRRKRH